MATTLVEFGFNKDGDGNVIYNNITNYVISVSIDRGKQNTLTPFAAGQATVELQNRGRTFDPNYDGSPYIGQIKPTGSLRITTNGVVTFLGLINDWNLAYSVDGTSTASIVAADAFSLFNNQTFPDEVLYGVELSSVRLGNVLNTMSWPAAARKISQGRNLLVEEDEVSLPAGTDVLGYMQLIEASEGGRLFMDRDGNVVFRSGGDNGYEPVFTYKRYNLSYNPSFEIDNTNWGVTAGSVTRSTAVAYKGSASGLLGTNSSVYQDFNQTTNTSYTVSFYVRTGSGTSNITLEAYNSSDGVNYSLVGSSTVVANANIDPDTSDPIWQRVTYSYVAGYDKPYGRMRILNDSAAYVDAILIEASSSVDSYFDGSTPPPSDGFSTFTTSWVL